jgi:hypothetical protein
LIGAALMAAPQFTLYLLSGAQHPSWGAPRLAEDDTIEKTIGSVSINDDWRSTAPTRSPMRRMASAISCRRSPRLLPSPRYT